MSMVVVGQLMFYWVSRVTVVAAEYGELITCGGGDGMLTFSAQSVPLHGRASTIRVCNRFNISITTTLPPYFTSASYTSASLV